MSSLTHRLCFPCPKNFTNSTLSKEIDFPSESQCRSKPWHPYLLRGRQMSHGACANSLFQCWHLAVSVYYGRIYMIYSLQIVVFHFETNGIYAAQSHTSGLAPEFRLEGRDFMPKTRRYHHHAAGASLISARSRAFQILTGVNSSMHT